MTDPKQRFRWWADALYGFEPSDSFVEIRYRPLGGSVFCQEFIPVTDRVRFVDRSIELTETADVYAGVAPRIRQSGKRVDIERVHAVWVDCDGDLDALRAFKPRPAIVVYSGSGGAHAYWPLEEPVSPEIAEDANARLAHHLNGDMQARDAARILRVPGTLNHKHTPPAPVVLKHISIEHFPLDRVVGELEPAPVKRRERPAIVRRDDSHDPLMAYSSSEYVWLLSTLEPDSQGKVPCPFHDEQEPSLQTYQDPGQGWYCYGCSAGGSIIDYGSKLYNIEPRGEGYKRIRSRLALDLYNKLESDGEAA